MNEKKNDQVSTPVSTPVATPVATPVSTPVSKIDLLNRVDLFVKTHNAEVIEFHEIISTNWKNWKSRELATIESAIRGIANDLDRLMNSIPAAKLDGKDESKAKPR